VRGSGNDIVNVVPAFASPGRSAKTGEPLNIHSSAPLVNGAITRTGRGGCAERDNINSRAERTVGLVDASAPNSITARRQLALKVLAHHAGANAGSEAVGAAALRVYDQLARVSAQLIGHAGVDALTGRALHLAQQEYPWLVYTRELEPPEAPFSQIVVCLKRQDPAVASEAAAAVFGTITGLLVTFIGEPLTMQLLRKTWPDAFAAASGEEHNV
jgi:hypothetical protein